MSYVFGFPHQWVAFQEQHKEFLESFEALADTITKVTVRTFIPKCDVGKTVYFLGSVAAQDFTEVWMLAGNGLGTGANKVLRGMYERAVTAAYLARFPDQAQRFLDYANITTRKLFNHAKDLHGVAYVEAAVGSDFLKEIEEEYQMVRADFKDMHSWSKLNLLDMAKKAGYGLEHCYFYGHALPTQQIHSTALSFASRVNMQADGTFLDDSDEKRMAAQAVMVAHVVMLKVLRLQNAYFALGFDEEIKQRETECKAAWPRAADFLDIAFRQDATALD